MPSPNFHEGLGTWEMLIGAERSKGGRFASFALRSSCLGFMTKGLPLIVIGEVIENREISGWAIMTRRFRDLGTAASVCRIILLNECLENVLIVDRQFSRCFWILCALSV